MAEMSFGDRLLLSRLALCALAAGLLALAWIRRERTGRLLRDFFVAADDPLNLAVFRIVLFATLCNFTKLHTLLWFSQMPKDLRIMPWGSRWWLLDRIPITEASVTAAWLGLNTACVLAVIGVRTRLSAAVAAILSIYVLGIPQFFGKVNHYHHLVWFAAILAASRCADALSWDALKAAWRRADRGVIADPPGPSRAYALPIRFAWLLMGIIYFFPGFWKWWASGVDWAFSDNFQLHLYARWAEKSASSPFLRAGVWRIDQYPLLCQLAAFGAIVFEMGFLWCVFSRRLRLLAAGAGVLFHEGTKRLMGIDFGPLVACYVTFLNWAGGLRRLGGWLFKAPMQIVYDGNCRLCRRTIAVLRVFDVLGRVAYVNTLDEQALRLHGVHRLDRQALLADMHAVVGTRRWLGYEAYRAWAWRLPLLWPLLPLLYLWPIPAVGRRLYRHVADGRTCEVGQPARALPGAARELQPAGLVAVTAVGAFLLAGNLYYGIQGHAPAWPLACYPTFRNLMRPEVSTVAVAVVDQAGRMRVLDESRLMQRTTTVRWKNLLGSILSAGDETVRRQRLEALWSLWAREDPGLHEAAAVRFYKVTRSTLPGRKADPPLTEELLWEKTL